MAGIVIDSLLTHWRAADPATRRAGRSWYAEAEREAVELSREAAPGVGPVACAGILAALSPRAQWSVNVRWAWAAIRGEAIGGLPGNRAKAAAIATGTRPDHVLRGPKVRAFWRAIAGDPTAAVVDVWMARAMGLGDAPLTPKRYAEAEAALREAARRVRVPVRDFQATVWLQARGIKPTDPAGYRPAREIG